MELEEGDNVLCVVDRIVGTTVFVHIQNTDREGSIVLSEIAPGRIRNLREYVIPKKLIVCQILKDTGVNVELSLRRVKEKDRKKLMDEYKLEKSYTNILKTILKEKADETIQKIKKEDTLINFFEKLKENSEELKKFIGAENTEKILEILKSQKKKISKLKKEINLTTNNPKGITLIKEILEKIKNIEIKYLAAGRYILIKEDENLKKADMALKEAIDKIEKDCKKIGIDFKTK